MPATPVITTSVNEPSITVLFDSGMSSTPSFLKRDGIYIGKTIPAGSVFNETSFFVDYQTRSGQQVSYVGSAFDGTQESAPTPPLTASVTLSSAWIHHVAKGTNGNVGDLGAMELSISLEGQTTTQKRE